MLPQSQDAHWKPNMESHEDQMMEKEQEEDLKLGSSILSQNSLDSEKSHPDQESPKKLAYASAITELFSRNRHPSVQEMRALTETHAVRYKTVFEKMEKKREKKRVKCEEGDNCDRIREFFRREAEPIDWKNLDPLLMEALDGMVEEQILSKRKMNLGFVHSIMEKTNLCPALIRSIHSRWRQRLTSRGIVGFTIAEWRRTHRNAFSRDSQRRLEEIYLQKKYECEIKEWSREEILYMCGQVGGASEESVVQWIKDRDAVAKNAVEEHIPEEPI